MSSSEPRSRDEWLAEVRRRGERIRRRRRLALSGAATLALALPGLALVSLASRDRVGDELRVAASGPAPATPATGTGTPPLATATTLAVDVVPAVPTTASAVAVSPTTTAEVHRRVAVIDGSGGPRPNPTDDPVVRPATTYPPAVATGSAGSGGSEVTTTTSVGQAPLFPCPTSQVSVTAALERTSYQPGEPVRGTTSIRNDSAKTCLLAPRESVHVEDESGRTVGAFAYTMEYREPVVAAPGRAVTASFTWDQRDCSGTTCAPVAAGAYVVVAKWPLTGPTPSQTATYGPARATFRIGG